MIEPHPGAGAASLWVDSLPVLTLLLLSFLFSFFNRLPAAPPGLPVGDLELERIDPIDDKIEKPLIIETHGESPQQYPVWDSEEWDDEEWEE